MKILDNDFIRATLVCHVSRKPILFFVGFSFGSLCRDRKSVEKSVLRWHI